MLTYVPEYIIELSYVNKVELEAGVYDNKQPV